MSKMMSITRLLSALGLFILANITTAHAIEIPVAQDGPGTILEAPTDSDPPAPPVKICDAKEQDAGKKCWLDMGCRYLDCMNNAMNLPNQVDRDVALVRCSHIYALDSLECDCVENGQQTHCPGRDINQNPEHLEILCRINSNYHYQECLARNPPMQLAMSYSGISESPMESDGINDSAVQTGAMSYSSTNLDAARNFSCYDNYLADLKNC